MIKKNKWKILISSLVMLIPTVVGLILWNQLPSKLPIHWGPDGQVDGWGSPALAVVLMPLILLGIYWLCLFLTSKDKKQADQSPKAIGMIFWIMPFISLFSSGIIYAAALGMEFNFTALICVLLGIVFLVVGNYMPKCKQNYTLGVKLTWTLANEENWNATHRFAGKIWVGCGILLMLCAFLPMKVFPFVALGIILLAVIPTAIYSSSYFKKQVREGRASYEDVKMIKYYPKWAVVLTTVLVVAILAFAAVIIFTGEVTVAYGDTAFTVDATYTGELTVNYADVNAIEYREDGVDGHRVSGFGSPKLLVGWFRNDEFGNYTRYTCGDLNVACVVVTMEDGSVLVLGGQDDEASKAICDELIARADK
ncbi:MAG: SdpI family protein [Clostridia bacterium]|nr:SdpI family protein [Clostridia bacterium]